MEIFHLQPQISNANFSQGARIPHCVVLAIQCSHVLWQDPMQCYRSPISTLVGPVGEGYRWQSVDTGVDLVDLESQRDRREM